APVPQPPPPEGTPRRRECPRTPAILGRQSNPRAAAALAARIFAGFGRCIGPRLGHGFTAPRESGCETRFSHGFVNRRSRVQISKAAPSKIKGIGDAPRNLRGPRVAQSATLRSSG